MPLLPSAASPLSGGWPRTVQQAAPTVWHHAMHHATSWAPHTEERSGPLPHSFVEPRGAGAPLAVHPLHWAAASMPPGGALASVPPDFGLGASAAPSLLVPPGPPQTMGTSGAWGSWAAGRVDPDRDAALASGRHAPALLAARRALFY